MSPSQKLTVGDVRSVFYLLAELRDLGDSPALWKRHMLCGLCRLIDGQVAISVQTPDAGVVDWARDQTVDVGWAGEKERNNWIAYCRANQLTMDPSRVEITRLITAPGAPGFARPGELLCPNQPWYSSDHVQITCKESVMDRFIVSRRRLINPECRHWLYLLRPWNDRPFAVRQRRLVRLFHEELGRILDQDAIRAAQAGSLVNLSPRQRQTLDLLAAGLSEKQVARKLVCSTQTVHGYVKELHRRFDVHSRAELLIKRSRQDWLTQPRLVL